MEWNRLISEERLGDKKTASQASRSIFVQDHDRIVFSAPFRRLANKTQVQPLYEHDHVHHRLIHSIEVSSVGRSLAMRIGQWLVGQGLISPGDEHALANIVQAASVAHDIGNPPFGHSGEDAMGSWFAEQFAASKGLAREVDFAIQPEFTAFEGNAQGFRILTRLEMRRNDGGMRLSKATLGAFMKYPVTARTRAALKASGETSYVGLKKFGFFSSEETLFDDVATTLGLPEERIGEQKWWRRHPLVYVVEAADDICYNIVDIEDAFTTGELSYKEVVTILVKVAKPRDESAGDRSQAEHVAMLRAMAIGQAIESCVKAFIDNHAAIMDGTFSGSLTEVCEMGEMFTDMRQLSNDHIFTARRKTELEVSGRRIINNVMSGILPVYEDLAAVGWQPESLGSRSQQLVRALDLDLRNLTTPAEALHALADYTSGMTDRYALRISKMLSGH
ncbi:dNTP triphosphohydrolase [Devosia sp. BK]|uniref:dGTP triphosphohydrolase n=1 Tax=Devosia sp. BK TaxID=2871706 RepID=UPI00293AA4C8|nr:dNTP triphosphohydrolase [Devosia sp. BK]MDV3250539.1 dNTP triphosphohydrolase [Devosia sp. BK]